MMRGRFWKCSTSDMAIPSGRSARRHGLDQDTGSIDADDADRDVGLDVAAVADDIDDAAGDTGAARRAQRGDGDAALADELAKRGVAGAGGAHGVVEDEGAARAGAR